MSGRRARDRRGAPREIPRRMENDMTTPAPDASQGASPAASADSASSATERPGAPRGTRRWLVKTEPSAYSFADLVREGRTRWEGVENPLALIHLRSMRAGDLVLVSHTGSEKSVVGLARGVKGHDEEPAAQASEPHSDAPPAHPAKRRRRKSGQPEVEGPRHAVVDLEAVAPARTPVSIGVMRIDEACRGLELFKISRLSVMPVDAEAWASIARKAGLPSA